ncbi:MAG: hypothetical protein ABIP89_13395 [Polyangiaceae bacterium]
MRFADEIAEIMRTAEDLFTTGKLDLIHGSACWNLIEESAKYASADYDAILHSFLLVTRSAGVY